MRKNKTERAIVAGASAALKHKAKNPKMLDEDIISLVVKELKNMIEKID